MCKKSGLFCFILWLCVGCEASLDWDIAIAVKDQILLLTSNGTYVGTAAQELSNLKALAFDPVRHQFLVSDMFQYNEKFVDTIYNVQLSKEQEIKPIIQELPDDVQGITVDPLTDTLYWTDSLHKTISYISLKNPGDKPEIFMRFEKSAPKDITIDSCNRYLYWTTADITNSSIERANLDTKQREILVNEDLDMPAGITIDLKAKKLYWLSEGQDIYYRIESTDLDGENRVVLYEGTHQSPHAITVDSDYIYWSDTLNNALWRKKKNSYGEPEAIKKFEERPQGITIKNMNFSLSNKSCEDTVQEIKESLNISSTEYFDVLSNAEEEVITACLNNGEATQNGCKCPKGFTGKNCEISLCHNYCLHGGECTLSLTSYPTCRCPPGFTGGRCEKQVCDSYCLNDGVCQPDTSKHRAHCLCPSGFSGPRCEQHSDLKELCNFLCAKRRINQTTSLVCRCEEGSSGTQEQNVTAEALKYEDDDLPNRLKDPGFLVMVVYSFTTTIGLCYLACKLRRRPRIKKRIIVNKNVTPLTYRPQPPTEQCEITIENCCNMNVCETPCFEPSQLRGYTAPKKEEKKNLLTNMENNGEDLY